MSRVKLFREKCLGGIPWEDIFRGEGGYCPEWNYLGGNCSGVVIFGGIIQGDNCPGGNLMGDNCPWGSCPGRD